MKSVVEKISFEIKEMKLGTNVPIVKHIYESSMHQDSREHPLVQLCQAMTKLYPVNMKVDLKDQEKAYVTMAFDNDLEEKKVRQLSKRFQSSTEQLLKAKLIRIYEKYPQ
ncbi:hypothetical protein EZV73_12500 [Acidaminobacter sp. JC074]|uniref:hypothetical protein n=1 Tax=Acidaminobacter sp. JC074 TaxID=2530199 RepID=UPI001F0EB9FA|nr:hypothetical protein [Acidaminobacter sp. JC074]MCH4888403.1 hypothetical protein [Acidaminobacter sp. JC074]